MRSSLRITSNNATVSISLTAPYIGSRYQPRFKVTRDELNDLAPRVKTLLKMTEQLCRKEIARLGAEADMVGPLGLEPRTKGL
jgi:hypothetical protein